MKSPFEDIPLPRSWNRISSSTRKFSTESLPTHQPRNRGFKLYALLTTLTGSFRLCDNPPGMGVTKMSWAEAAVAAARRTNVQIAFSQSSKRI